MNSFSIALVIVCTAASAHARLGETREQTEARYGLPKREKIPAYVTPLLQGARELEFHYQGFKLRCALLLATDGKEYIVREVYSRLNGGPIIKDFELNAILEAERNGSNWTEKKFADLSPNVSKVVENQLTLMLSGKKMVRPDGATAQMNGISVTLELPQAAQHEAQLKAVKEQQERAAVPKF